MCSIRKIGPAAALAVALTLLPAASFAFGLSGVGGKLGVTSPENLDATATFGGHLEFEEPGSRWHLLPSVMFWNSNGISDVNPNFDVYYHFDQEGVVTPYIGAGLGVHVLSASGADESNTDVGANVFGGVRFPMTASHLFVEGRYAATDVSHFGMLGGVTFHMH